MTASDALLARLIGIAEGVAAYGDSLDNVAGDHLASAAREAVDQLWVEAGTHPSGYRESRDEIFSLLLNTQPAAPH